MNSLEEKKGKGWIKVTKTRRLTMPEEVHGAAAGEKKEQKIRIRTDINR